MNPDEINQPQGTRKMRFHHRSPRIKGKSPHETAYEFYRRKYQESLLPKGLDPQTRKPVVVSENCDLAKQSAKTIRLTKVWVGALFVQFCILVLFTIPAMIYLSNFSSQVNTPSLYIGQFIFGFLTVLITIAPIVITTIMTGDDDFYKDIEKA